MLKKFKFFFNSLNGCGNEDSGDADSGDTANWDTPRSGVPIIKIAAKDHTVFLKILKLFGKTE